VNKAGPRRVGAPSRLIISGPSNRYSLGLGQRWRTFWRAHVQIADNFRRNSVACGKAEFTGAIFPIIPVISLRPYSLVPQAAAQLACHLVRLVPAV